MSQFAENFIEYVEVKFNNALSIFKENFSSYEEKMESLRKWKTAIVCEAFRKSLLFQR